MRELALHILDIAQNSVAAGARHIWLTISENEQGYFVFSVSDDGKGMEAKVLEKIFKAEENGDDKKKNTLLHIL